MYAFVLKRFSLFPVVWCRKLFQAQTPRWEIFPQLVVPNVRKEWRTRLVSLSALISRLLTYQRGGVCSYLTSLGQVTMTNQPLFFSLFHFVELQRCNDIIRQLCETASSAETMLSKRLDTWNQTVWSSLRLSEAHYNEIHKHVSVCSSVLMFHMS